MAVLDNLTEQVDVYAGQPMVKPDLNAVPSAVTKVAARVRCNIHRGTKSALDEASALGINSVSVGYAYFAISSAPLLADRSLLLDQDGVAWIVRGTPSRRSRFAETAHVKVLVQQLLLRPHGMPPA